MLSETAKLCVTNNEMSACEVEDGSCRSHLRPQAWLLVGILALALVPDGVANDFRLSWRTCAWWAIATVIAFSNAGTASRAPWRAIDVCYVSLTVLWTFVGIVQGGIRGVVAPSEMCAGAVAIYWLGRTCRNTDHCMGTFAAALCACGMACVGITLTSGGVLGHVNLVACYLGMCVVAALAPVICMNESQQDRWLQRESSATKSRSHEEERSRHSQRRFVLLTAIAIVGCWVILSGSRGAAVPMVACVIIVLCVRHKERVLRRASSLTWCRLTLAAAGCATALAILAAGMIAVRPSSVVGRVLMWRVSLCILADHPWLGIGKDCFGHFYNHALAGYMSGQTHSAVVRMSACGSHHAMNEWIERLVEMGIVGVVPYLAFHMLALGYGVRALLRAWREGTDAALVGAGMACTVFMMMACMCWSFPNRFMPCIALYAAMLGMLVTWETEEVISHKGIHAIAGLRCSAARVTKKRARELWSETQDTSVGSLAGEDGGGGGNTPLGPLSRGDGKTGQSPDDLAPTPRGQRACTAFWLLVGVTCVAACVTSVRLCITARTWRGAEKARSSGCTDKVLEDYQSLMPALGWNGKFLASYGDAVSQYDESSGNSGSSDGEVQAVELYEQAKRSHPDPFALEHLALAYVRLAGGSNWPDKVQTVYMSGSPFRKKPDVPPENLSRADCIGHALDNLMLASDMLPWRLTPKFYLADLYRQMGDTNSAVKYARLVVDTPMKKYTAEGVEFKKRAMKMLDDLGAPCADPGIVVFDVWDRKTWNEGRW